MGAAARVEDQDIDGVDAEVLFGAAVGDAPLPSRTRTSPGPASPRTTDWLADFCSYAPDRLIGMAYIPCDDPDDAIAESARRGRARGLRGAVLPHQPPAAATGPTRRGRRCWRTIVELGWPAHLHVAVGNIGTVRADSPRRPFMNYLVASKFNMPLSLGALRLRRVLAEHPDLKLVSRRGQIGWIPFWKYYIDHVYEKHRWHQNVTSPELPSTYVERQMWFTFMEDPPGIEARHACGIDRIMWSNDYPHSETTWPHSQKIIGDIFERVPAEEVRKIVRDNCVELYGL